MFTDAHLTCKTSVVWLSTAQLTGEFGGVAGMMLKMQGCLITPIPFLNMAVYFQNCQARVQVGPGQVQVGSRSAPCNLKKFQYQGLFQISKRPGPGACSYNCNATTTTTQETFLSRITLKSLHV